jgi:hypothetical protein
MSQKLMKAARLHGYRRLECGRSYCIRKGYEPTCAQYSCYQPGGYSLSAHSCAASAAFWDRRTGKYAVGGSYLDSLDYSDRLLGKMLDLLEAQPRWATTTLIVQGDHSWRTKMWRPLPG